MHAKDEHVIVACKRSPIGAFQGGLKNLTATDFTSQVARSTLKEAGINPKDVTEVIVGCVLPAGLGQAPARQVALKSGLSPHTLCTTVNKVCGSGLKAVMAACDTLSAQGSGIILAGGMESMTNAPYLLTKGRSGYRFGHQQILDHLVFDGLEDAYEKGSVMGALAENTVKKYGFTRKDQDDFALESVRRARQAWEEGKFDKEVASIELVKDKEFFIKDEIPFKIKEEKIPQLKPAFREDGTITPASSSSLADGASLLLITSAREAEKCSRTPKAVIRGYATHAHEPMWFTTAPCFAIKKLCQKVGWDPKDVDLWEINEAFAVVTMAAIKELKLDPARVNVYGGAVALGHPIGASGARVLTTLLNAMEEKKVRKGIASLCIGGGEAVALAVERCF